VVFHVKPAPDPNTAARMQRLSWTAAEESGCAAQGPDPGAPGRRVIPHGLKEAMEAA